MRIVSRAVDAYRQQKRRIARLFQESAWIAIGQVISVAGSLVLVRVLTEYLSPAEYGHLALGMTVAGLVNQVATGGLTSGIGRFYAVARQESDLTGYLQASRRLLTKASLIVICFGLVAALAISATPLRSWTLLALVVVAFALLNAYNSALNAVQNAARQRVVVAFHGGLDAWLKILLAVLMMMWVGGGSAAVMIGYALAALIVNVSQYFALRRLLRGVDPTGDDVDKAWEKRIWAFSWPFSAWGIFTWAQQASDRWALQTFAGSQEVGQYAVLYQLGYAPIGLVTTLAIALLGPIFYQRSGNGTDIAKNESVRKLAWRFTALSLGATLIAFLVAALIHAWLFKWLVAESFRSASYLLPWFVLAGGLFAAGQMLSLKLLADIRPNALLRIKIVSSILGVTANIAGAALFGVVGVVMALVFFSSLYLLWMIQLSRKSGASAEPQAST